MSAPWEKYQATSSGPWAKYATQPPATEPVDNQTLLQKVGDFLQPVANAAGTIQEALPYAEALMGNPLGGMATHAMNKMNEAAGSVAEPVAEFAASHGVPSPAAATLGMLAPVAVNPISYIDPAAGAGTAGRILEPIVPASRAFDVATAEKYGLPMTRADLTGDIGSARLETGLSKTLTGGGGFQKIAAEKLAAIDRAKEYISSKFGTGQPVSASGAEAKMALQGEMSQAGATAGKLYKDIPDVAIPTGNIQKAINDLDFGSIDKGAAATINEIKGRLGSQPPITEETFPQPFSPQEQGVNPKTAQPGDIIRPSQSQYRIGPVNPPEETLSGQPATQMFQKLNDVRNLLSKEIQSDTTYNPIMGNQIGSKAQTLIPLKKALDQDLKEYAAKSQGNPLGKLQSGEFSTAFNKANAYYGAMKNLKNNKFVQKLSKVPESDIPKTVFGTGRIEDINVAKAAMGQKGFNAAKQQFFNDLLDSKNLQSKIAKLDDPHASTGYEVEFLKGAFSDAELNALKEAASLKKTSLTAEKLAGNPSGTGQMVGTIGTLGVLGGIATRFAMHPSVAGAGEAALEAGMTLGGPYLASKAYLGTTRGIPYSFGAGSAITSRAAGIGMASSSNRPDVHAEFIKRYIKVK